METYPNSEKQRLSPSRALVLEAMQDGKWVTLEAVAAKVGMRNASTAASRLRDLKAMGPWTYERKGTDVKGVFLYRLYVPAGNLMQLELLEAVNA